MNPFLSHQLTQMALDSQQTFLAEAATVRLIRQARRRSAARSPLRHMRSRVATALHSVATLLDHTVAPAPRAVAL